MPFQSYNQPSGIPFIPSTLCEAERSELITKGSPEGEAIKPGTRKRRRQSTPPEQLDEDDKRQFQADEERAERRAEHNDSSYHGSSGSRRLGQLELSTMQDIS